MRSTDAPTLTGWIGDGRELAILDARVECVDTCPRPHDRNEGVEDAMREYLSREVDPVREAARDGDARFGETRA